MLRQVLLIVAVCLGGQAYANDCPPFYRFVDFGTYDRDGLLRRGGMIFRAFDENADHLLQLDKTVCMPIANVSKDGRQLPIPIVSHIEVDMNVASLALSNLSLNAVESVTDAAEENARTHRETVADLTAEISRGESYLCARLPESDDISCQLVPPYGDAALVVYCNGSRCEMPVLQLSERVAVHAEWPRLGATAHEVAFDILTRLQDIEFFLDAQI